MASIRWHHESCTCRPRDRNVQGSPEETTTGDMHATRLNTANHGRYIIALPPGTALADPCPLLRQPHLFQKQVGLVIEAIIFHPFSISLVERVTADVHPRHL